MTADEPSPYLKPVYLSVIIPVFNEEAVLPDLLSRLERTLPELPCEAYEVIFVDDGSSDASMTILREAAQRDDRLRLVSLSRNFGHQMAITAGMQYARGDAVTIMDGDLQDPPELLASMMLCLASGFDVVYAVRRRRRENPLKRLSYWLFYRLLAQLSEIHIPLDSGDFCLMRRNVVDAINRMPERHRFVRGLRSWVGFRQVSFEYDRPARAGGEPKYTLSSLLRLALDGVFTMSYKPLRVASMVGAAVAGASLVAALRILIWRFSNPGEIVGYASLATGVFFLSGVQLITIGILGEYIGRIHHEVKARPVFLVREVFPEEAGRKA